MVEKRQIPKGHIRSKTDMEAPHTANNTDILIHSRKQHIKHLNNHAYVGYNVRTMSPNMSNQHQILQNPTEQNIPKSNKHYVLFVTNKSKENSNSA